MPIRVTAVASSPPLRDGSSKAITTTRDALDALVNPLRGDKDVAVTADEWIAVFADRLGLAPPDVTTAETLLALAGTAAHASERTAAPIACYLVGLAGLDVDEAARIAAGVAPAG